MAPQYPPATANAGDARYGGTTTQDRSDLFGGSERAEVLTLAMDAFNARIRAIGNSTDLTSPVYLKECYRAAVADAQGIIAAVDGVVEADRAAKAAAKDAEDNKAKRDAAAQQVQQTDFLGRKNG